MSSQGDLQNLLKGIDARLSSIEGGATAIRQQKKVEEKTQRYLLVSAGEFHLAIHIENLVEVGDLPPVTYLPNLPAWLLGIINIRSEIVSVIDFPHFLRLPAGGAGKRLVVLRYGERKLGIRTSVVYGSVARSKSTLKSLDLHGGSGFDTSLFRAGLIEGDRLHYVLDVRRFLTAPRLVDYNRSER